MPTPTEITASTNVIAQYELLQWAVGVFGSIVVAMATAFVIMYRDGMAERKEWNERQEAQSRQLIELITKTNEVVSKNTQQTERLIEVVDRNERATQNLEKLILQKLT